MHTYAQICNSRVVLQQCFDSEIFPWKDNIWFFMLFAIRRLKYIEDSTENKTKNLVEEIKDAYSIVDVCVEKEPNSRC